MVRLLPTYGLSDHPEVRSFNPTMVRLLQPNTSVRYRVVPSFNPTMVRLLRTTLPLRFTHSQVSIPQWCDCCGDMRAQVYWSKFCFNPTMVRLLQLLANFYISLSTKFQSHNGAIAA